MRRISRSSIITLGILGALALPAVAFFDEVADLRAELEVWEVQSAADFSDVLTRLDAIAAPIFRDIHSEDWFTPYISSLADWGVISGYRDSQGRLTGEFRPGNAVTVAEVLKMALEAANVDEVTCGDSPQHPQALSHWAKFYVACAESLGMRLFLPEVAANLDREAKRAEVVVIVHDAFREDVLPLFSSFTDTVGHPFEADIAFAAFNGIVSGDTDERGVPMGTFRPNDSVNRAESAKMIYEELKLSALQEAGL
jgi:hypothetical protein